MNSSGWCRNRKVCDSVSWKDIQRKEKESEKQLQKMGWEIENFFFKFLPQVFVELIQAYCQNIGLLLHVHHLHLCSCSYLLLLFLVSFSFVTFHKSESDSPVYLCSFSISFSTSCHLSLFVYWQGRLFWLCRFFNELCIVFCFAEWRHVILTCKMLVAEVKSLTKLFSE